MEAAVHGIKIGHQLMAQGQEAAHDALGIRAELPGFLAGKNLIRAMQAHNGRKHAVLHPAGGQFVFPVAVAVAADIVAPPSVSHVGGRSGKPRLVIQRLPRNKGASGETDGIAMTAQTGKAREVHGTFSVFAVVQIVVVVQHPKRVVPGHAGIGPLLPVQPPEIHAHLLIGMVQILEIGVHKLPVGYVKGDGQLTFRIHAHGLCHVGVHLLMGAHAVSRVNVQRNVHTTVVKFLHHARRVREQFTVPCVAGPTLAVLGVNIHIVPAHILNCHRNGQLFVAEAIHQLHVLLLRVAVIAAPPVAQRVAGQHGRTPGEMIKIVQTTQIIPAIAQKIDVGMTFRRGAHPAVVIKYHRGAVVNDGKSVAGQDAVTQLDFPIRFAPRLGLVLAVAVVHIAHGIVQCLRSALQIAHL